MPSRGASGPGGRHPGRSFFQVLSTVLDAATGMPLRVTCFDPDGNAFREQHFEDVERFDAYPFPTTIRVEDRSTGTRSTLHFEGARARQARPGGWRGAPRAYPFPMRLGVALSSGGAAAMAQVGVLEVLVEAGIQVDCVAGTSGGAIVGAAFCNGRMGALRDAMCGLSRRRVLSLFDPTWPRMGMLEGRRAMEFVKPCLAGAIEALPVPYAALATDLDSGLPMALRRGDVSRAVRASVAIPGVLTPVHWGDRVLVDGALSEPIPVGTCRALGARFALAVSVLPLAEDVLRRRQRPPREPLMRAVQRLGGLVPGAGAPESDRAGDDAAGAGLAPSERRGLVQVILRASHVGQCQIAALRLREEPPDFLLTVPVPRAGLFDFHRSSELVEAGRRAARDALPALGEALRRAEPVAQRVGRWLAGGSG